MQEQARIRLETEKEFESKLAELEAERKRYAVDDQCDLRINHLNSYQRLRDEKVEVQKQKEYFAKLRTEFQPDGGKVCQSYISTWLAHV